MAGFLRLWHDKHHPPPDPTDASFEGKTVLVTGATVGLGFEASLKILRQGVSVLIIGCRDLKRGQQAKQELERRTGRSSSSTDGGGSAAVVQVWSLDMSSFQSVQEFAARINREIPHLHVALLNAGVLHRGYVLSDDGWEDTLQVNTLSTALLAVLLLPKLRESSLPPRNHAAHLVIVSSGTAARITEKDFPSTTTTTTGELLKYLSQPTGGPPARKRYPISKLLVEYCARSIAEQTRNPDGSLQVIVNTVKPGFCVSSLGRQYNRWYERWAATLFTKIFARSTEAGSRVLVSAAVQGEESHGRTWQGDGYMSEAGTLLTGTTGKRLQRKAWSEIVDVLKEQVPELRL